MGMIAFWRAVLFLILTIVLAPIQLLSLALLPPLSRWLPVYYFRIVLWILDVQVQVRGDLPLAGTLVVSNHISWLDIVVLGAQRPTHFIAKSEIGAGLYLANWQSLIEPFSLTAAAAPMWGKIVMPSPSDWPPAIA